MIVKKYVGRVLSNKIRCPFLPGSNCYVHGYLKKRLRKIKRSTRNNHDYFLHPFSSLNLVAEVEAEVEEAKEVALQCSASQTSVVRDLPISFWDRVSCSIESIIF